MQMGCAPDSNLITEKIEIFRRLLWPDVAPALFLQFRQMNDA
jgi:hypothetical protein